MYNQETDKNINETVFVGDTSVSLHTLWVGEGILGNSKLKVLSPDQIFIGGEVFLATQNSKSPSPDKIFIPVDWGWGVGVEFLPKKISKATKPN